jgi:hypothetical protein
LYLSTRCDVLADGRGIISSDLSFFLVSDDGGVASTFTSRGLRDLRGVAGGHTSSGGASSIAAISSDRISSDRISEP